MFYYTSVSVSAILSTPQRRAVPWKVHLYSLAVVWGPFGGQGCGRSAPSLWCPTGGAHCSFIRPATLHLSCSSAAPRAASAKLHKETSLLVCTWGRLLLFAGSGVCVGKNPGLWRCATMHGTVSPLQHQGAVFVYWILTSHRKYCQYSTVEIPT